LTPGRHSFGEFSFLVLAAKSQDFNQVAIEERVEPLARVSRTQFHSIDSGSEHFCGFFSYGRLVQRLFELLDFLGIDVG